MNKSLPFSKNLISRLVQIKQVFLHGKGHSLRAGEFEKLQAILSFDQAVELFLYTVIAYRDGNYKADELSFYKLWVNADLCTRKSTKKRTEQGLPLKQEIFDIVHGLRNNSQHKGHIPSKSDLSRARDYTAEFLRRSFMICFEESFDEIFLADAIRYKDVRQAVREAEEALSKAFMPTCRTEDEANLRNENLQKAMIGLARSYDFLKPHMVKNLPWDDSLEQMLNSDPYSANPGQIESTIEMIKYVDSKVNILSSGGNLQDYALFLKKRPIVNVSVDGKIIGVHNRVHSSCISEEESIRMFNFVYNMTLHCQSFE